MALSRNRNRKKDSDKPKKKGLLNAIGVKTAKVATPEQEADKQRDDQIKQAWEYLRAMIDKAVLHYYRTGAVDKLAEFVERPALDDLKAKLETLRERQIFWSQPDRRVRTQPKYDVLAEGLVLGKDGHPSQFVIEERSRDFSVHQHYVDGQAEREQQCPGRDRIIRATVNVRNGQDFTLKSLKRIS